MATPGGVVDLDEYARRSDVILENHLDKEQDIRICAAAIAAKKACAVSRPVIPLEERVTVTARGGQDGEITPDDLVSYGISREKAGIDMCTLMGLYDSLLPQAMDIEVASSLASVRAGGQSGSAIPADNGGVRYSASQNEFRNFKKRASRELYGRFADYMAANRDWLAVYAVRVEKQGCPLSFEEIAFVQWVASRRLQTIIEKMQENGLRVRCSLELGPDNRDALITAAAQRIREGFSGVRVEIKGKAAVPDKTWINALADSVVRTNPDAETTLVAPADIPADKVLAGRCRKCGVTLAVPAVAGSIYGGGDTDGQSAIELYFNEDAFHGRKQLRTEKYLADLLRRTNARYVSVEERTLDENPEDVKSPHTLIELLTSLKRSIRPLETRGSAYHEYENAGRVMAQGLPVPDRTFMDEWYVHKTADGDDASLADYPSYYGVLEKYRKLSSDEKAIHDLAEYGAVMFAATEHTTARLKRASSDPAKWEPIEAEIDVLRRRYRFSITHDRDDSVLYLARLVGFVDGVAGGVLEKSHAGTGLSFRYESDRKTLRELYRRTDEAYGILCQSGEQRNKSLTADVIAYLLMTGQRSRAERLLREWTGMIESQSGRVGFRELLPLVNASRIWKESTGVQYPIPRQLAMRFVKETEYLLDTSKNEYGLIEIVGEDTLGLNIRVRNALASLDASSRERKALEKGIERYIASEKETLCGSEPGRVSCLHDRVVVKGRTKEEAAWYVRSAARKALAGEGDNAGGDFSTLVALVTLFNEFIGNGAEEDMSAEKLVDSASYGLEKMAASVSRILSAS